MHIPTWKKWLSHLIEIPVEKLSSDLNPHLFVSLKDGKFQLSTRKAIYSYDEGYDNFGHTFTQFHLPPENSEILVLGLGLGSIPILLERTFKKKYRFVGVEQDPVIVDLFSRYTLPRLQSQVEVINADAYAVVMQNERQFPLVCMDVFKEDLIPAQFKSIEYLNQLKISLSPGGILLYNCLALSKADKKLTRDFFDDYFLKVFPKAGYITVLGNWVLVSDATLGLSSSTINS